LNNGVLHGPKRGGGSSRYVDLGIDVLNVLTGAPWAKYKPVVSPT
jgi:hypothetical protein